MNDRTPLVSILCTAYNHEPYIRQTMESFVGQQTDFAFEALVNDDQSTDGTAEIIREFAGRYPDIIRPFYQSENLYSRDIDIYQTVFFPNARGRYVAYCEGDDYWTDSTKLQRQVDFLEAHPEYAACVHNTTLHYCDGSKPDAPHRDVTEDCDVELTDIIPGMDGAYHTSSLLARTEILASPPDFYRVACDYGFGDYPDALWLRLHGPIRYLAREMSVYRVSSGAAAWSSGVGAQYAKLRRFIVGKVRLLQAFRAHAPEEYHDFIDTELRRKEFELMYVEGRDREQRQPPYDAILRTMPLRYRLNNFIKSYVPGLQRVYRAARGYKE